MPGYPLGSMDEFKRLAVYVLKGIVSIPLAYYVGSAALEYDAKVGEQRFTDPDHFAEVNRATGNALDPALALRALWQ